MYITKQRLLLKVASKYSIAIAKEKGFDVITEVDIFAVVKNIPNVMMLPNSYSLELPQGDVINPWGPTVNFQYETNPPVWSASDQGDMNVIRKVETALRNSFTLREYISNIVSRHVGNGRYTVTITQPPQ